MTSRPQSTNPPDNAENLTPASCLYKSQNPTSTQSQKDLQNPFTERTNLGNKKYLFTSKPQSTLNKVTSEAILPRADDEDLIHLAVPGTASVNSKG